MAHDQIPIPTLLYHITHVRHLPSMIQQGHLFCQKQMRAAHIEYTNIAHVNIQYRRASTQVPCGPGGILHDYVPFYFGPRCPMLYAIERGAVEGYRDGQRPIVHLVTSVQAVGEAGLVFVFTDGHGTMSLTDYYTDLADLAYVDWPLMRARYWADTFEDPDRSRRRQAEFLVHDCCPWTLITEIGVMTRGMQAQVEELLQDISHRPSVTIRRDWYY